MILKFSGDVQKYLISKLFFFACNFATLIFFSDASIPTTSAPIYSLVQIISPPPQPISKIFNFF